MRKITAQNHRKLVDQQRKRGTRSNDGASKNRSRWRLWCEIRPSTSLPVCLSRHQDASLPLWRIHSCMREGASCAGSRRMSPAHRSTTDQPTDPRGSSAAHPHTSAHGAYKRAASLANPCHSSGSLAATLLLHSFLHNRHDHHAQVTPARPDFYQAWVLRSASTFAVIDPAKTRGAESGFSIPSHLLAAPNPTLRHSARTSL